jgi:hypothetical protein
MSHIDHDELRRISNEMGAAADALAAKLAEVEARIAVDDPDRRRALAGLGAIEALLLELPVSDTIRRMVLAVLRAAIEEIVG